MWKSGKLPKVTKPNISVVENSKLLIFTYQTKVNYFIIVSTKTGEFYE